MKYFYTNPFAAGWMQTHFGIEYQTRCPISRELNDFTAWDYDRFRVCCEEEPLYIHPDSLHLLEPRIDDVVGDCHGSYWAIIRATVDFSGEIIYHAVDDNLMKSDFHSIVTIMRNGIAFIMPESEE